MSTALRIVVAPLFSRSLSVGDTPRAEDLYRTTTNWIVLLSTPLYVLLAMFGGTVLSTLGNEFRTGAGAMAIMSIGLIAVLMAGNIQSVLLMSGQSALAAAGRAASVTVFIVALLALVPAHGVVGAAIAFVLSMAVDAALAAYLVQTKVGVRVGSPSLLLALTVPITTIGIPAIAARVIWGDSREGLIIAGAIGTSAFLLAAAALRRPLELDAIIALFRRSPAPSTPSGVR